MVSAGALLEPVVRVYTRDILTGLAYLHQHRIMHRDVKVFSVLSTKFVQWRFKVWRRIMHHDIKVASDISVRSSDFQGSRVWPNNLQCDSKVPEREERRHGTRHTVFNSCPVHKIRHCINLSFER